MAVTKAIIYNQTCAALKLNRRFVDPDTDPDSNEKVCLDNHYATALAMALADLDLESTAEQETLALLSDEDHLVDYPEWAYVYEYPANCAKFRRIKSSVVKDVRSTRIPLMIRNYNDGVATNEKAIFTTEPDAIGEFIKTSLELGNLSYAAGLAISYKLAWLCAPLLVGKGAQRLQNEIEAKYVGVKMEAQNLDAQENFNYESDQTQSEFVEDRTS